MRALLFGSVGTVIESSELQREAYNLAFERHGLDWTWDQATYRQLLGASGGKARLRAYAETKGRKIGVDEVHRTKTEIFHDMLDADALPFREGVEAVIVAAHGAGLRLGLITGTEERTTEMIADALLIDGSPAFDIITHRQLGLEAKPAPALYQHALQHLNLTPDAAIAIEDNPDGVTAAKAAGLVTIGFPGVNGSAENLTEADAIVTGNLSELLGTHLGGAKRAAK